MESCLALDSFRYCSTVSAVRIVREIRRTKSSSSISPPFHRFSILELPVET